MDEGQAYLGGAQNDVLQRLWCFEESWRMHQNVLPSGSKHIRVKVISIQQEKVPRVIRDRQAQHAEYGVCVCV